MFSKKMKNHLVHLAIRTFTLLCDKDFKHRRPAFYIRFDCKFVTEVGKGAVRDETGQFLLNKAKVA